MAKQQSTLLKFWSAEDFCLLTLKFVSLPLPQNNPFAYKPLYKKQTEQLVVATIHTITFHGLASRVRCTSIYQL